MDEFALIAEIRRVLGDAAVSPALSVASGDDAAVWRPQGDHDAVASIDTLWAGRHFPEDAPGTAVGYRAMMVSLSDLAAMGAQPGHVLIALSLPPNDTAWALDVAEGVRRAAAETGAAVAGGNLCRGTRAITVSVYGEIAAGKAITRQGAQVGDGIYVSGLLGGAAAAVRLQDLAFSGDLSPRQQRYWQPQARFDRTPDLVNFAHAAIDISDGLLADLGHLLQSSGVGAELISQQLPLHPEATLDDALYGGDDYELLATGAVAMKGWHCIGQISAESGISLDGKPMSKEQTRGYQHFDH